MKIQFPGLSLIICIRVIRPKTGSHAYSIDLTKVVDDRVKVSLNAKLVGLADAENNKYKFHFPATIPGTYATLDYGRFIHDFKAFNASGTKLKQQKQRIAIPLKENPIELNIGQRIASMLKFERIKFLNLLAPTIKNDKTFCSMQPVILVFLKV